jgi:hypothetical protein
MGWDWRDGFGSVYEGHMKLFQLFLRYCKISIHMNYQIAITL